MSRIAILFMLFLAVAPLAGGLVISGEDQCEAARECDSGGPCDATCTLGCCASRATGLAADVSNRPPDDLPASSTPVALIAPISAPPTDILHVPKSS